MGSEEQARVAAFLAARAGLRGQTNPAELTDGIDLSILQGGVQSLPTSFAGLDNSVLAGMASHMDPNADAWRQERSASQALAIPAGGFAGGPPDNALASLADLAAEMGGAGGLSMAGLAGMTEMHGLSSMTFPGNQNLGVGGPRKTGRVKAWFDEQGFGFITQDDCAEDLFVHRSALTDGNLLVVGAVVQYGTVFNEQKQKLMAAGLTGASSPMAAGLAAGAPPAASHAGGYGGKQTGRVKAWFEDQGFGFVLQDDGSEDLFVHRSALTDGNILVVGAPVAYETVWNQQKNKMLAASLSGASSPMQAGMATGNSEPSSAKMPGKKAGRVKAWFEEKGFGFILQDDGSEDLFVHRSALIDGGTLVLGTPVLYETVWNERKQRMMASLLTGAAPQGMGGGKGSGMVAHSSQLPSFTSSGKGGSASMGYNPGSMISSVNQRTQEQLGPGGGGGYRSFSQFQGGPQGPASHAMAQGPGYGRPPAERAGRPGPYGGGAPRPSGFHDPPPEGAELCADVVSQAFYQLSG